MTTLSDSQELVDKRCNMTKVNEVHKKEEVAPVKSNKPDTGCNIDYLIMLVSQGISDVLNDEERDCVEQNLRQANADKLSQFVKSLMTDSHDDYISLLALLKSYLEKGSSLTDDSDIKSYLEQVIGNLESKVNTAEALVDRVCMYVVNTKYPYGDPRNAKDWDTRKSAEALIGGSLIADEQKAAGNIYTVLGTIANNNKMSSKSLLKEVQEGFNNLSNLIVE